MFGGNWGEIATGYSPVCRRCAVARQARMSIAARHRTFALPSSPLSPLDSRPRAHPAGQHGPCAEIR